MASSIGMPKLLRSDDPLKDKTNLPDQVVIAKMTSDISPSIDTEHHILLSPPRILDDEDPTKHILDHDAAALSSSFDPETILKHNFAAHNANAHHVPSAYATDAANQTTLEGLSEGLHIKTDFTLVQPPFSPRSFESDSLLRQSTSASSLPRRAPSIRAALHSSAGSLSPGSVMSSPQLNALLDISPLPSPILAERNIFKYGLPTRSRGSSTTSRTDAQSLGAPPGGITLSSPPRRKAYHGIQLSAHENHPAVSNVVRSEEVENRARTRSVSEYVPGAIAAPKTRNIAVSGSGAPAEVLVAQPTLHREEYLADQRGLTTPISKPPLMKPPTPPRSTVGGYTSGEDSEEPASKRVKTDVYIAKSIKHGHLRKYKAIRFLGQGTFSKVFLAVRQVDSGDDGVDYSRDSTNMAGVKLRSQRLVAVKVVEHGPAGGAHEERIEVSLKREVDIMRTVAHPSLVHLKAFGTDADHRALLVMNYCPGGDLFEVASTNLEVLVPSLVRRIFSELVSAVSYLHQKYIVHRDIKLENVLLNIPVQVHSDVPDWQTCDRAVVTLTDLGLSRRIPEPPESPLLTTRCGSEDYAAPELLMGQEYDGRQTDAWALGVLLYALMEGRLPFDLLPGARGDPATLRARTPHRIARCEWAWYKYGDEDGNWDPEKGKDLEGARLCVDGLLKRNSRRKSLGTIREMPWVKDGIRVDGGLRWVEEDSL